MMRTTVSTQPQIIIVACCITLRRSAYDTAGNIRSITKDGTVTKSFGYTNPSWPDLLTSVTANGTTKDVLYEGQSQTSDLPSSGNPITYYNGKDYTFTWTKGRQLASATVDGKQVSYTYDMSGVRSGKQVYTTSNQRTTTYTYTTLSGKVMRQQWETRNSDDTVYQAMQSLEFVYDDGNQPFAMIYKHGQTTELYYYVLNAQGDVIALLNANGALVASYNYGAWGNYSVHDKDGKKNTSTSFIGHINPLRYRGYYYDRETRLYYLQSRYYDFANCRFINADAYATTNAGSFLSCNMFAYCGNNPVNRADQSGTFWKEIGSFFNKVGTAIAGFAKATFGAGSSLSATITKTEVEYLPDPLPITVKLGTKTTQTISKHGNSSKPISVYAKGNAEHPIKSSSAGIKINIAKFTLDISMGLDNIGISGSLSNGNTSKDFYREHKIIRFDTLSGFGEYEIVAVFKTVAYSEQGFKYYHFTRAESAEDFDDYIAQCKALSLYDTGITAEYGDRLITLSTCEYSRKNGRMVVVAKRIAVPSTEVDSDA